MKASVQYNDYRGTAAADKSDHFYLNDFLKGKGIDVNKYNCIGAEFYSGDSLSFACRFLCVDNQSNDEKIMRIGFESKMSFEEFFSLFKRFNVVITLAKGSDYSEWKLADKSIMIDDRE